MKRISLTISSMAQLCLWSFTALRYTHAEETVPIITMILAAAASLAVALFPQVPRWAYIVAALAQIAGIAVYVLPAYVIGGQYAEGAVLLFITGLFAPFFLPAVVNAALALWLLPRRHATPA